VFRGRDLQSVVIVATTLTHENGSLSEDWILNRVQISILHHWRDTQLSRTTNLGLILCLPPTFVDIANFLLYRHSNGKKYFGRTSHSFQFFIKLKQNVFIFKISQMHHDILFRKSHLKSNYHLQSRNQYPVESGGHRNMEYVAYSAGPAQADLGAGPL